MTTGSDFFDLSGRLAVVTGSNRGIGQAIAVALADFGAEIIGTSTSDDTQDETAAAIRAGGGTFHPRVVDFSSREATARFVDDVTANHPPVEILVNNAGTIHRAPALDHSDEEWDRILEVNLTAPFILARHFGRSMVERGGGRIIFVASLLSFQGGITVPSYTSSKSGLAGLTKALANEWASANVTVNAIAPGYIATDNTEALRNDAERFDAITARIPAGRWGTPSDLAGAAVFLASPASAYVNGTVLVVDGGWMGR